MGCFSFMFADTNNKKNLLIGKKAYVPCPDGTILYESFYGGYGVFDGKDIYEEVVYWNIEHLSAELLKKPDPKVWNLKGDGTDEERAVEAYNRALNRYKAKVLLMNDIKNCTREELKSLYGWNDKELTFAVRLIGIDIACGDEKNESLPYPIKICKERPASYEAVKASSNGDPNQGMY